MAAVPPPPDLDHTIPIAVRRPQALPLGNGIGVSESLVRLYLLIGALAMLLGAALIASLHEQQPAALPVAAAYALVALLSGSLLLAPAALQQRWNLRALALLVALSVLAAGLGAYARGYGLATPSLLLLPVLVFAITALLGWRAGLVLAAWVLVVMGTAHATATLQATPVPTPLLAAGLLVALAVAVLAGWALNARIRLAMLAAAKREQRFRRLLALAADVYWEVDERLHLVTVGRQTGPGGGKATARHGQVPWTQLPALQIEAAARRRLEAAVEERQPFRDLPVAWRHGDGQQRDYLLSGEPRLDPGAGFRGYWGVARDITAIERTRAALENTQQRYENLFRHAPLPLILHDSGRIVDANPAAARLIGRASVEGLRGLDLFSLFASDEERHEAQERLLRLTTLPPGTPLPQTEFRLRGERGEVLVSATGVRLLWADRWTVLTMCVDITERRQSEQALRRSEAMLAHLIDTSPDTITLSDLATGRYRMVNRAFERSTGYATAEALGRTSMELGIWGSEASREAFVKQIREHGAVSDLPVEFRRRDGSPVTLLISAAQFSFEGRPHLVINGRDITASERDRLERAAILDNAGIGIAVTREQRFVLANAEFERMIGWAGGSLIGQSGRIVWPSEADYAEVGRLIGPALASGQKVEFERLVLRRDGSTFLSRLRAGVVDPARPQAGGTVWIVEDITERRQSEDALARARDEAEAANRAKSAFLANTSHELRTPLNGLLGLARLARDEAVPEPQRRQYLEQIEDSAQTLAAIISDILDLSKIEAGRLVIENAPFDLHSLLHSVARTWRTLAQARGLSLELRIEDEVGPRVQGDALRLRQVVTNFVANAIKFTERGYVRLRVRRPDGEGAAALRIECEDSGPGIAPEILPGLFKPFTQADQSTTRRFGGTGLGLSICRELAELMGGRVGVDSEPGHGSRFWVQLPLPATQVPAPAPAVAAEPEAPLAGMRVLMVEDNAVNMLIAVATLERWGVQVTQAADGHEALRAFDADSARFDAVLMDVQMPGMSGHETTRELRRRPAALAVPVIALTAAALVGEREQALAAGMDDFLTKPIDPDRLQATLRRWRAGRQGVDALSPARAKPPAPAVR